MNQNDEFLDKGHSVQKLSSRHTYRTHCSITPVNRLAKTDSSSETGTTERPLIVWIKSEARLECSIGWFQRRQLLKLNPLSSQAVFTIAQLYQLLYLVPHCTIIFHHHTLHGLDQTALNVTCKHRHRFACHKQMYETTG